jgi:integrase/recombinase XerD
MTVLRQKMIEDMQLRGLAVRTQESYMQAVRQLAGHYHKSPDQISEEELRQYFLFLKNVRHVSRSTHTLALCAIKFFYEHTLKREWHTLDFARPAKEQKLPVVLSMQEVGQILNCIRFARYRVCLTTIYACGLRLLEGVSLQVKDIDGQRKMIHVRQGKGGKDRYVPLPDSVLIMLRIGRSIATRSGCFHPFVHCLRQNKPASSCMRPASKKRFEPRCRKAA